MSKTKETQNEYLYRAENLLKRYKEETLKSWAVNPINFCDWLAEHRNIWKHSTWRQNKAAVIYFMQKQGPKEVVEYLSDIKWDVKFKSTSRKRGKTSSQKAKKFKDGDLKLLLERLEKNQGELDYFLRLWLLAGMIVGLRPNEWDTVVLENNTMIVQNSKNTNGRSFGPTRRFHLVNLRDEEMSYIKDFLKEIEVLKIKNKCTFNDLYEKSRKRLYYINRQIFPKRKTYPTLYTCRHHLASELKSSNYPLVDSAAIFGHATDETLTTHYGRKEWGSGGFNKIEADIEDKNKIKKVFQQTKNIKPNKI